MIPLPAFFKHCLFPPNCQLCHCDSEALVCKDCRQALPDIDTCCLRCALPLLSGTLCAECQQQPPAYVQSFCAFSYRKATQTLIARFKDRADLATGRWLSQELCQGLEEAIRDKGFARPDCFVPVPMHPRRALARGFNQAEFIARQLSAHFKIPWLRPLYRHYDKHTQKTLSRKERKKALQNAFYFKKDAYIPARVALVDDVLTTGATCEALALHLLKNGAKEVQVVALARTPKKNWALI